MLARNVPKIPIFTFVTDQRQYREMRESFAEAGFTQKRVTFKELRSRGRPGEPEPYSTASGLIADRPEPFVILCHQDVRLDQGHGFDEFVVILQDLERRDPSWALAGNAGGSRRLRLISCITDPWGERTSRSLPSRVHSLDENFIVLKTGTGVRCSPGLGGFHLFGTDLCLNALRSRRSAYVIGFHLRHLSPGRKNAAYAEARDRFVAHWSTRCVAEYVRPTAEVLFFSRFLLLRKTLGHWKLRRIAEKHELVGAFLGLLFAPRVNLRPALRRILARSRLVTTLSESILD
jgi:hypothetical protein